MKKHTEIKISDKDYDIMTSVLNVIQIVEDHIRNIRMRGNYSLQTEFELIEIINELKRMRSEIGVIDSNSGND